MTLNVLGTKYEVGFSNEAEDARLVGCDAYCDYTSKTIVLDDMNSVKNDPHTVDSIDDHKNLCMRHEIVHAFLNESGLMHNSWGTNEEIVDWIAIQFPKLYEAFKKAGCLN